MKRFVVLLLSLLFISCAIIPGCSESDAISDNGYFIDSAMEWLEQLDTRKNDYEFSIRDSETEISGIFRKNDVLTEIDLGEQGRFVFSDQEFGIEQGDTSLIVDLTDVLKLSEQSKLQAEKAKEDIQWLIARAGELIEEAYRPYISFSFGETGLSVRINIDDQTALVKLADCLDELLNDPKTKEIFERHLGLLALFSPDTQLSYEKVKRSWAESRESLNHQRVSGAVSMDLNVTLEQGFINAISCFGNCAFSYRDSYHFDFQFRNEPNGWHVEGQVKDTSNGKNEFSLNLTGNENQLNGDVSLGRTDYTIRSIPNALGETTICIESNSPLSAELKIGKQRWETNIYYYDDVISASFSTDDDMITAAFKTTSPHYYNMNYEYDFRMNKLPDDNWWIRLNGINRDGRGYVLARHYINAEIGKNKIAISYWDNPLMRRGYELEAERHEKGFQFRIHLPDDTWWRVSDGYEFLLQKEGMISKFNFSYPYDIWNVSGNGSLMIDTENRIRSLTGKAVTSYLDDPDKTETRVLTYSPGELMYIDETNVYRMKKTEDTARTTKYRFTRNSHLKATITANLTDSVYGDGLSISVADEEKTILQLSLEPREKEEIVPINQERSIIMTFNMFLSLIMNGGL